MEHKLRWGILGTGNIAGQFAEGVRASRRGQLAAVGSRSMESATQFAAKYLVSAAVGSYQELIAHPAVDAVYVSLPNSLHKPWTVAALGAGKHVLCEKPIGINADEARDMFAAAKSAGRILVEAFMYRSHPLTLAVQEAARRGDIGELRLIRSSFCFHTNKIVGNVRFSSELYGGSLMDVGCYCINFSRLHAGCEPDRMAAAGKIHSSGVDEMAAGFLGFPNGVLASFACGMTVHTDNTAYLCGSEGYIEIPIPWKPPGNEAVYIVSRSTPPRMEQGGKAAAATPGSQPKEVRKVKVDGALYGIEADDFAAAVMDGQAPRLSAEDSIGNMRVLDELRRQAGVKF